MGKIDDILQVRPGRVAVLLLNELGVETADSSAIESIEAALRNARVKKALFAQSLIGPDDLRAASWLKCCGFAEATEVLYLVCPRQAFLPAKSNDEIQLIVIDQSPEMQKRLSALMLATYEGSHDCPLLNGWRRPAEVLESYRAAGSYTPQHWWIVQVGHVDAGCLILARHAATRECEVVYMAVLPIFRRRGLGSKIVDVAKHAAIESGAELIGLAVDAANQPALSLYFAAGFELRAKHRLFLRRI